MSVHIILEKTHTGKDFMYPVSSQSAFRDYWLVFAEKNSLPLIQQMGIGGFVFDHETLNAFIAELEFMHKELDAADYFSKETIDYLKERIDLILPEIIPEKDFDDVYGWIG